MPQPTVLLTGATGFIARRICLDLLDAGYFVRASTRDPARGARMADGLAPHLDDPAARDRLEVVALDLGCDAGWDAAMDGVAALIHTASPFPMRQPTDAQDLIRPAVDGARRALAAAARAGVGRAVMTSSAAAVIYGPDPGRPRDDRDWSDPCGRITAYGASKTLAERAAWEVAGTEGIDLTTINPGLVLGPPVDAHFGTSLALVQRILRARDPLQPDAAFPVVDVRDVAALHLAALRNPATAGQRLLASAGNLSMPRMARRLAAAFPERRISTRRAPDLLVRALALVDPAVRSVLPDLGRRPDLSTAPARALLMADFIPPEDSLLAAARWLIDHGRIR